VPEWFIESGNIEEEEKSVRTTIDTRTFRQVAGQFPTGVSVVATEVNGAIHGMTVNSLTTLSLNPMLMLFCLDRRANMAEFMQQARGFSINILREEQEDLSTYFAGGWKQSNPPPFRFVEWTGGPRLEGCVAAMGCRLQQFIEAGDHWIVTGEVIALHMGAEPHSPLIFHGGVYRKVDFRESRPANQLDLGKNDVKVFFDPWDEV
jgi:flavin reductase (DIM6/NTAB) family NADH-FMN oxidoreductase RutF